MLALISVWRISSSDGPAATAAPNESSRIIDVFRANQRMGKRMSAVHRPFLDPTPTTSVGGRVELSLRRLIEMEFTWPADANPFWTH